MKLTKIVKNCMPYGLVVKRDNRRIATGATSIEPELYNSEGEKKRTFYLCDNVCVHSPYSFSSIDIGKTKYINWDRSNVSLPIHFYSHECMLEIKAIPKKKFGILIESETIIPELYDYLLKNPNLVAQFDGIFTHSDKLLKKYNNTYFIPGSSVWYGGTTGGGKLNETAYLTKRKNISMVSSEKRQCALHDFRLQLAEKMYNSELVDVMGTFRGGKYVSIVDSLEQYRYSIVLENNITPCYFTEKLLNCFAAMTIPIYMGATEIDKFFDEKGIIRISPQMRLEEIGNIITNCSEHMYKEKIQAIKNNYSKVKDYFCIEDYIYTHYKYLF